MPVTGYIFKSNTVAVFPHSFLDFTCLRLEQSIDVLKCQMSINAIHLIS